RTFDALRFWSLWPPRFASARKSRWGLAEFSAPRFAKRDLWNIHPDQLILAPANLITFAHFSVYSAMNVANSAGEGAKNVQPQSAMRAWIAGWASPALTALLSLSITSTGVLRGAPIPCQPLAS